MDKWLVRGLAFAGLMIVVRVVQATLLDAAQTQAVLISLVALAVVMTAAAVWGWRDGRADAIAQPDAERRDDLAMTWLIAGLVAGAISGVVAWLVSLVYSTLYSGGLINELTTFAAFTALLVFLPAVVAVALGRWTVDRSAAAKGPDGGVPGLDEAAGHADTDVFAAVTDVEEYDDAAAATAALGGAEGTDTEATRG